GEIGGALDVFGDFEGPGLQFDTGFGRGPRDRVTADQASGDAHLVPGLLGRAVRMEFGTNGFGGGDVTVGPWFVDRPEPQLDMSGWGERAAEIDVDPDGRDV